MRGHHPTRARSAHMHTASAMVITHMHSDSGVKVHSCRPLSLGFRLVEQLSIKVNHSLGEEPVQDSLILLHLGHVLYRIGRVGLEMLELAQELLPITVQQLLFLLHLLYFSPGALLLGCAFKHMRCLTLGCCTNDAPILTYMRSC